mgnify:CR=1 FL=1
MKQTLKNIWKSLSRTHGSSLAEFATVAALMATLAATAAPKLSEIAENTKAEKTSNEIGKILKQAQTFYNDKADGGADGRGRFPGQDKFDEPVGEYADLASALAVLGLDALGTSSSDTPDFVSFKNSEGAKWRSVFGVANSTAPMAKGGQYEDDSNQDTETGCQTCSDNNGNQEWLQLFNQNALKSPYQDGHYIYVVIAGSHAANSSTVTPPILIVADAENPRDFNNWIQP